MKKLLLHAFCAFVFLFFIQLQATAQGTYNICSITQTTDTSGTLFDTGGPTGGYQVTEDCSLLVQPSCAVSITLNFTSFETESGFDFFTVYDGTTINDPQVLSADGNTVPGPVTCTSGSMLIVWHSDISITFAGFECNWTSVIASSVAPTADFVIADPNPPLATGVQFTDLSVGSPTAWLWDFGDGDTARSQNPVHAFDNPGTYTITLIAFTCNESDTITQTLTVQGPPQILVTPDSLVANAQCGDIVNFNLAISNIAGGELVYNLNGASGATIRVLSMKYGSDLFAEYPHTIAAINQYFTNYTLTETSTTDPGTLSGLLVGKNVLLIPEQETGDPNVWTNLGPVIRQFLNNGGSVIWCGSYSSESDCMFNTGVWTGTFNQQLVAQTVDVINAAHPLVAGLGVPNFTSPNATFISDLTNPDKEQIVAFNNSDVVATRIYGSGKAIFIAFDYYSTTNENARILANAISWGGENNLASWVQLSQTNDTVAAGNTSNVTVTFQTTGLPAGTYYTNIAVSSNDPVTPMVIVPCTLTVSGLPIVALSDSCVDFGQVMQFTNVSRTFNLINNGCDTLFVGSITSNQPEFSVTSNVAYLLPGAYSTITVDFQSSALGPFNAIISIPNNDVDTTVCVSALSVPAPVIDANPVSGVAVSSPACGTTTSSSFYLLNTGGSDLNYSIAGTPAWVTTTPTGSGTLTAGDSVLITLDFNTGVLVGGDYTTNILFTSNDPQTPTFSVPCTLTVGINPCIDYTFTSNTCTGFTDFTSTSINIPDTYHWDFGDGDTSDVANPTHAYASNGTYTVTLIACNAGGCDTATYSVQAIITGPVANTCYPATTNYCCGVGLVNVTLAHINNNTNDGIDGYQDYTCTDTTTLLTNNQYWFTATTGIIYVETVKAWIDWNNDGSFDPATEQVFGDSAVLTNHAGFISVPGTATLGQPLRFRVASDYSGNASPTPCLALDKGQVEDYSIFLTFDNKVPTLASTVGFNVYPNPFNRSTKIEYKLNSSAKVSVEVFNVMGEKVQSYSQNELQSAGKHSYSFETASNGVYFVKLTIDGASVVEKIVKM
ncbi:MAG: PKD domain-containing protein [Bacteroidetes bacterium]|nr:PKD domain-containing protein [Bacteroidota bacterium]MBL0138456.1 PKD domain-containing protein [Bacteroidota bacterium]